MNQSSKIMSNYDNWKNNNVSTMNDILKQYSISVVNDVFPWAVSYSSGIILVDKNKILLVLEKSRTISNSSKIIQERYGIPKGSYIKKDGNLFNTAVRELEEETNIKVSSKGFKLSPITFTIERKELPFKSVHIYFIVFAKNMVSPKIKPNHEVKGYKWHTIGDDIDFVTNRPCYQILSYLSVNNIEEIKKHSI